MSRRVPGKQVVVWVVHERESVDERIREGDGSGGVNRVTVCGMRSADHADVAAEELAERFEQPVAFGGGALSPQHVRGSSQSDVGLPVVHAHHQLIAVTVAAVRGAGKRPARSWTSRRVREGILMKRTASPVIALALFAKDHTRWAVSAISCQPLDDMRDEWHLMPEGAQFMNLFDDACDEKVERDQVKPCTVTLLKDRP